jgi:hypothetical protein
MHVGLPERSLSAAAGGIYPGRATIQPAAKKGIPAIGESFQMLFEGSGFVVIQPYEEVAFQSQG